MSKYRCPVCKHKEYDILYSSTTLIDYQRIENDSNIKRIACKCKKCKNVFYIQSYNKLKKE